MSPDSNSGSSSGLTVRWSLAGVRDGIERELCEYVAQSSHARFEQREGLRFKTWRMRAGEWFEGNYVFVDDAARVAFQESFSGDDSPVTKIIGSRPTLIEECALVAVAGGPEGFISVPSYDAG
jgi:hypothetical protein